MEENYVMVTDISKKVCTRGLWDEYCEWSRENGYDHYEAYPNFHKYFENKPKVYTMGKKDNQKALCGIVNRKNITSPIVRVPVISGDPVDWYFENHMVKTTGADADSEIQMTTFFMDYVKKVEAAGGSSMDIWPLYGVLLSKGFTATMGTPGVASEIKVKGWRMKTDKDREQERKDKLEVEKNKLWKSVNQAMEKLAADTEMRKMYLIIRNIVKTGGLDSVLNGMEPDVKAVFMNKIMSGSTWDNALAGVAAKRI